MTCPLRRPVFAKWNTECTPPIFRLRNYMAGLLSDIEPLIPLFVLGIMQGHSGKKNEVKRSLGRPELRGQDNIEMSVNP